MSRPRTTIHRPPGLAPPPSRRAAPPHRVRTVLAALVAVGSLAMSACSRDASDPASAHATPVDPSAAFDAATVERLDELVRTFQETNHSPGALVGIWSPQGTYVSATGVSDLATGAPLEPDMQFKIASQTKSFTGNLVLQLVSEGKVALDDRISQWVEGVPNGDEITIRQLLNHTSGLADGFTDPSVQERTPDGCTVDELLTAEAAFPPVAEPGEKWSYSNYGFNLLGRVVELVEDRDLSAVLRERITEPLGLSRTSLATSGRGLTAPYTHGYGMGELGPAEAPTTANDATDISLTCLWAHGGMVSTLEDMHVWMRSMESLIDPEVWTEATADPVPFVFGGNYNGPGEWFNALGFDVSGGFYVAEGSFAGYESASMYSPTLDTTISVATTKMWSAINPPPMMQALAIALYGDDVDFGLTLDQAMAPNLGTGKTGTDNTTTTVPTNAPEPAYAAELRPVLADLVESMAVPSAVVLVRSSTFGDATFAFGSRELGHDDPPTTTDHYRIGSLTKTMTATVILQLVQEGRVSLDDPISEYRPEVPNGADITIAELLDMRSGLAGYDLVPAFLRAVDEDPERIWSPEELLAIGYSRPARFEPGTAYDYSNTNYILLGLVMEQVTGQTASELFQQRLFDPLGLDNTTLPAPDDGSIPAVYAHGYQFASAEQTGGADPALAPDQQQAAADGELAPTDWSSTNPSWGWTAGSVISTADEVAVWAEAVVDGRLLDADMQARRMASFRPVDPTDPGGPAYGSGLLHADPFYGHAGLIFGYNTQFLRDPGTDTTIVVLTGLTLAPDGRLPVVGLTEAVIGLLPFP